MPITVFPNIWINRRYASQAKRSFIEILASPKTDSSFIPTFKMVSIMPGIENLAPDRTLTNNGSFASPRIFPA